jgi:hypothetical protein
MAAAMGRHEATLLLSPFKNVQLPQRQEKFLRRQIKKIF